jgi:hypothetical protein
LARLLRILGVVLILGGMAHTAGVVQLYVSRGVPDANRIMLDIWIAEAQLSSGALYVAAWRSRRAGSPWRGLAAFGALTMIGFAVPILPVLISRAPLHFWIPNIVYLAISVVILAAAIGDLASAGEPITGDSKADSQD